MYKAIGHCRVSKGDTNEIKNSLASQKSEILKLAERIGIKEDEIKWYIEDEARSSYSLRADWQMFDNAINEACTNSSIKYFLDYSQERFCRNISKSNIYKMLLEQNKVKLCFVCGNIEDRNTIEGFTQDKINEVFAELYSRKISLDTLRGCKENAQTRDPETGYAFKNGGSAPFWLKPKKVSIGQNRYGEDIKKIIWVENDTMHSAILNGKYTTKSMWEWSRYYFLELRLNQKLGIEKARDILNELEIPAPRGKYWANTCLYEAERNESLIGIGIYNKRMYSNNGNGREKDKSEWIIVENAHPSLLTKQEFEALQILRKTKLKRKGTETKFQSNNQHLLAGYPERFTCSCCGSKIISSGNVYTCGKYNTNGKKGCGASYFSVQTEWLENKILDEILSYLSEDVIEQTYSEFVKVYAEDTKTEKEIKKITKAISEKEVTQQKLIESITAMNTTSPIVLDAISNKIEKVSLEIEKLKEEKGLLENKKPAKIPSLKTFKTLLLQSKLLLTGSESIKNKEIIWNFVNSIKLDPIEKEVIVEFKKAPFDIIFKNTKKAENKIEGAFAPSMKLVAGAGFEPTTFGL